MILINKCTGRPAASLPPPLMIVQDQVLDSGSNHSSSGLVGNKTNRGGPVLHVGSILEAEDLSQTEGEDLFQMVLYKMVLYKN